MSEEKELSICLEKIAERLAKESEMPFRKELLSYSEIIMCPKGYGPLPETDHKRKFKIEGIDPRDSKIFLLGNISLSVFYGTVSGSHFYDDLPEYRTYTFIPGKKLIKQIPGMKRIECFKSR